MHLLVGGIYKISLAMSCELTCDEGKFRCKRGGVNCKGRE